MHRAPALHGPQGRQGNSMRTGFSGFSVLRPAALAALTLLAGAAAQAQSNVPVIDMSSVRGTGTSQSDVLMENVRLMVPVANPFQPGTSTTVETGYNVTFRLDPTSLHLVPVGLAQTGGEGAQLCATANVTVFDAVRGAVAPLANASVTLGNQTLQTNAQGQVTFTRLPASLFSVSAVVGNYVPASQAAMLSCAAPANIAIALSPSSPAAGGLGTGQFRVILTWGQNPSDLDSHMTGPAALATDARWHVYYGNHQAGDTCGLDVDDVSSFGPETITCPRTSSAGTLRPGVYRYSVHHYTGSGNIGTSGASVRLEFAGGQQYRFTPPAANYLGSRDVWTVFELTVNNNGQVSLAPVNSVMSNVSSGSVRATGAVELAPAQFGSAEDMEVLLRGPGKR